MFRPFLLLTNLLMLYFLIACDRPQHSVLSILADESAQAALVAKGGLCNPPSANSYHGQLRIHTVEECRLILSHMVADTALPEVEAQILEITAGAYPAVSKVRHGSKTQATFVTSAILGTALSTPIPQNNRLSRAGICNLTNSYSAGFNKVCQYTCGINAYATTVSSTSICPMRP